MFRCLAVAVLIFPSWIEIVKCLMIALMQFVLILLLINSFVHSFVCLLVRSFVRSFIYLFDFFFSLSHVLSLHQNRILPLSCTYARNGEYNLGMLLWSAIIFMIYSVEKMLDQVWIFLLIQFNLISVLKGYNKLY